MSCYVPCLALRNINMLLEIQKLSSKSFFSYAHTLSHTLKTFGAVSSSKTPLALICLLLRGCIYVVILLVAYYTFTHYELLSILSPFSCIMYVHLDNYS